MWTWHQQLGELYAADGERAATGYSGHGDGVNNPQLQSVPNVGPIPQGVWMINEPRDTTGHGPYVMPLTPKPGTETFGRSGFLMHGDSMEHAGQHLASEGCIILPRMIREEVWHSGDHDLEVMA